MNIKNRKEFIEKRKWTAWVSPSRKIDVGKLEFSFSDISDEKYNVELVLGGPGEEQLRKIIKLLPVLTDVYLTNGRRLQITIDSKNRIKLKILIEKAINCVGCGACLSLCKFDALHIENGSVCVDPSKCNHCKKCITSTDKALRGGCIVRNYSSDILPVMNDGASYEARLVVVGSESNEACSSR